MGGGEEEEEEDESEEEEEDVEFGFRYNFLLFSLMSARAGGRYGIFTKKYSCLSCEYRFTEDFQKIDNIPLSLLGIHLL